jgi:hypothetical protein
MRLNELIARGNPFLRDMEKFYGVKYSEESKLLVISHINSELKKNIDNELIKHVNFYITESFGKMKLNPVNIFTSLLFNGFCLPEAINYKDNLEFDWSTLCFRYIKDTKPFLYVEKKPLKEIREVRLNKILNNF